MDSMALAIGRSLLDLPTVHYSLDFPVARRKPALPEN